MTDRTTAGRGRGERLTFGSLFSGIGGLDLGLERAGMRCLWQVEIDDFCRRVLTKHWPDVPKYGDIRELSDDELRPVDLICGGFPCQDISNAGKRAGINGERSGLWSEYIRLVRVLRPRFVLVENVAAILFRGLDTVLGDLAASGYDAEWQCIPAAAIGAPHIRDRCYVVAYTDGDGGKAFEGLPAETQWPGVVRQSVLHHSAPLSAPYWATDHPRIVGMADGVSAWVDRRRALGNAVVPQVAEWLGRQIVEAAS